MLVLLALLVLPGLAAAQIGGDFDLTWSTFEAGTISTGGAFAVTCTFGQPDASVATGGTYSLIGGFWFGGNPETGAVDEPDLPESPAAPTAFHVSSAIPNPFNPRTSFVVEVGEQTWLRAAVVDMNGRVVRVLFDAEMTPGRHNLTWDGQDDSNHVMASGVYFLRVLRAGYSHTQKLVLVK
jgi:hypothetical protein